MKEKDQVKAFGDRDVSTSTSAGGGGGLLCAGCDSRLMFSCIALALCTGDVLSLSVQCRVLGV